MIKHYYSLSYEKKAVFLIIVLYIFGVVFHYIPATSNIAVSITELFLVLVNGLVLFFLFQHNKEVRTNLFIWVVLTFLITFFIEVVGVKTGVIFGNYFYGSTMKAKLFGVPVIIALNWTVLIISMNGLVNWFTNKSFLIIFLSSVFIVFLDVLIEPIAMKFDYWQWENSEVPLQNYIGWFLIAFLFSVILQKLKIRIDLLLLKVIVLMNVIFFLMMRWA